MNFIPRLLKSSTLNGVGRAFHRVFEVREGGIMLMSADESKIKVTILSFPSLPLIKYFAPFLSDATQTVGIAAPATGSDAGDARARRRLSMKESGRMELIFTTGRASSDGSEGTSDEDTMKH